MKILTYLCTCIAALIVLASCNNEAEKKADEIPAPAVQKEETDSVKIRLKEAIKKIMINDLKVGGYTIEYLLVEDLSYKTVSMNDYYIQRKEQIQKAREEYRKLADRLAHSPAPINMDKYRDDSVKSDKATEVLARLIAKADTARTLYCVTYHLNAKTNTTPYNVSYTKYLFIKDLSEVKMQFREPGK